MPAARRVRLAAWLIVAVIFAWNGVRVAASTIRHADDERFGGGTVGIDAVDAVLALVFVAVAIFAGIRAWRIVRRA